MVVVQALLLRRSTFIMLVVFIPPHCCDSIPVKKLFRERRVFLWLSIRGHRLHHNTEGMAAERKHPHPRKLTSRPAPTDLPQGPSPQHSQRETPAENQETCGAKLNSGVNSGLIVTRVDQCWCLLISPVVQRSGTLSSGPHILQPRSQRAQKLSADMAWLRRAHEVTSLDHLRQQALFQESEAVQRGPLETKPNTSGLRGRGCWGLHS